MNDAFLKSAIARLDSMTAEELRAEFKAFLQGATAAPGDLPPNVNRYDHRGALMVPDEAGDYLLIGEVRELLASNARAAPQVKQFCACRACNPQMVGRMMFICPTCGDKRCPHAADHRDLCAAPSNPPVGAKEKEQ